MKQSNGNLRARQKLCVLLMEEFLAVKTYLYYMYWAVLAGRIEWAVLFGPYWNYWVEILIIVNCSGPKF